MNKSRLTLRPEDIRVTREYGKLVAQVPWELADNLQQRLKKAGFGATLHLDCVRREAFLVPWAEDLDSQGLQALLAGEPAMAQAV